jgi:hypothetical protein
LIVSNEAVLVEFGGGQFHYDDIVVTVQASTLVISGQMRQLMRRGKVKLLGDAKHHFTSLAE